MCNPYDPDDNDDFHRWSDSEYWEREARLISKWNAEDGNDCCSGGWILTNMDTWIQCFCGKKSPHPEYDNYFEDYEEDHLPTATLKNYLGKNNV